MRQAVLSKRLLMNISASVVMSGVTFLLAVLVVAGDPDQVRLPLAMLLIFGSAKLLDEVFERLNQPGIVGQILAGVLIRPSVLAWISPNDFLAAFAELGVMFLLFRVGLEVKSSDLIKAGPTATTVAVLGVIVPFFGGWGLLSIWGEPRIESIFVGAALVATSVGITALSSSSQGPPKREGQQDHSRGSGNR